MSEATLRYKRKRNIFLLIDVLMFMGVCAFLILYGFITNFEMTKEEETNQVFQALMAVYGTLIISYAIGAIVVYYIKNKARNTVWTINLILSVYLFGTNGMWVILTIWALDEFIVIPLYKKNRGRAVINGEFDKRTT